jgi:PAS domain S-box-containing protein
VVTRPQPSVLDPRLEKLEEALRRRDERIRLAEAVAGIGTYEHDLETGLSFWSERLKEILGVSAEGAVDPAKELLPRLHPEDRAAYVEAAHHALAAADACEHVIDFRVVRDDGDVRWLRDAGCLIYADADGERRPIRVVGSVIDLTAQKRAEAAARHQEQQMRQALARSEAIFRQMTEGLVIFDAQGHLLDMNPAALAIHGSENVDALRRHLDGLADVFELRDMRGRPLDTHEWPIARALRGETFTAFEVRVRRKDTGRSWIGSYGGTPVYGPDGELYLGIVTLRDVTAQREAEAALAQTQAILGAITVQTEDMIAALDGAFRYLFFNPAYQREFRRLWGRDLEPATSMVEALAPWPDEQKKAKALWQRALAGEHFSITETFGPAESGPQVYDLHFNPIHDDRGRPIGAAHIIRNVTERAQAQKVLHDSEQFVRRVLDQLFAFVGVLDLDGTLREANCPPLEAAGISAGDVLGRKFWDCYWWSYSPEVQAQVEQATARARAGEVVRFDVPIRVAADGRMWIDFQIAPLRDADDRITHLIPSAMEITARKEAEAALKDADQRKDEFLATLAHELRNPLAPLRTGLDLLQQLGDEPAKSEQVCLMMDRQLMHLVRLVDDLLDVSRITRGKIGLHKEPLDLHDVVESALEMSESEITKGGRRLTVDVPPQPLPVAGDRVRLVQVVSNLLNNAIKFTEEGGHIWILAARHGEQAQIRVRDDGTGIPPQEVSRVFEMFAQVNQGRGGGLGIGLTLVRSLVEMHGGSVWVHSDGPGLGAEFALSLPLARQAQRIKAAAVEAEGGSLEPRRVLVVDDNQDIADGLGQLLQTLGMETRVVYRGAAALDAVASFRPQVMLLDIGMPGMDGYEVARQVRARFPVARPKLIAVTGWGSERDRQRIREAGFDHHLVKPVGADRLHRVLSAD